MKVVETVLDVRAAAAASRTVGFVPTMGALHPGHLSLVRRARAETDLCLVSIFVNPTQFGPAEDIDRYPRPLDEDLRACEAEGVDVVFHPSAEEVYPRDPITEIRVRGLTDRMEGVHRPGHLEGVCLVVAKLLGIVGPCRAYFGRKDAQQLAVVRRMAEDLNIPAEIVGCETVRDPDGLALSSRNVYLAPAERERARCLSRALFAMRGGVTAGETDTSKLLALGRAELDRGEPDAVEYLEVVDPESFDPLEEVPGEALACGAIRISGTRLIDNVSLTGKGET